MLVHMKDKYDISAARSISNIDTRLAESDVRVSKNGLQ